MSTVESGTESFTVCLTVMCVHTMIKSRTDLFCVTGPEASEQRPVVSGVDTVPPRTLLSFFQTAQISLQQPQLVAASQQLSAFGL